MKFECGDLERALEVSGLMPEAREHLKHCAACRREFRLWNEISSSAKELHEEWESPQLWANIRKILEAEPKPKSAPAPFRGWKTWALAATVVIGVTVSLWKPWQPTAGQSPPPQTESAQVAQVAGDTDFLTEQALREVEKTEAAYRQSIEKLSRLAEPKLQNPVTAVAVNYKEKLLMLDSAISETRANLDHNRLNVRLQNDLAELYREKQQTLKELLTREQKN